jgi:hypothetical protein
VAAAVKRFGLKNHYSSEATGGEQTCDYAMGRIGVDAAAAAIRARQARRAVAPPDSSFLWVYSFFGEGFSLEFPLSLLMPRSNLAGHGFEVKKSNFLV